MRQLLLPWTCYNTICHQLLLYLNKPRSLQLRPSVNQLVTVNSSKTKFHLSAPKWVQITLKILPRVHSKWSLSSPHWHWGIHRVILKYSQKDPIVLQKWPLPTPKVSSILPLMWPKSTSKLILRVPPKRSWGTPKEDSWLPPKWPRGYHQGNPWIAPKWSYSIHKVTPEYPQSDPRVPPNSFSDYP